VQMNQVHVVPITHQSLSQANCVKLSSSDLEIIDEEDDPNSPKFHESFVSREEIVTRVCQASLHDTHFSVHDTEGSDRREADM
jgi:hypothetical protein